MRAGIPGTRITDTQDVRPAGEHVNHILPLAREYNLSAYDAAYLELSVRRSAPLASLDEGLRKAAKKTGAKIFMGEAA